MIQDLGFLLIGMAGGSDNQRFAMLGAQCRTRGRSVVEAKIDHRIAIGDMIGERVAFVHTGNHLQPFYFFCASDEHLAHAPLGSMNDYLGHVT